MKNELTIQGFNKTQIKNINEIINKLKPIDSFNYSSGGGHWHVLILLKNGNPIEFHNVNNCITISKRKYENIHQCYNDEEFQNSNEFNLDLKAKNNFKNIDKIVKLITL